MAASQYLDGAVRPIFVPFDTTDATITIAVGDLLVLSSNKAAPIGTSTVTTSFLGVAAQKKAAGSSGTATWLFGNSEAGVIRVDTDGVFAFDRVDTVALKVGDLVGPGGTDSTSVIKVTSETCAVGVVAHDTRTTTDRVQVKIQSTKFPAAKSAV